MLIETLNPFRVIGVLKLLNIFIDKSPIVLLGIPSFHVNTLYIGKFRSIAAFILILHKKRFHFNRLCLENLKLEIMTMDFIDKLEFLDEIRRMDKRQVCFAFVYLCFGTFF